jgi:hypothetical protein
MCFSRSFDPEGGVCVFDGRTWTTYTGFGKFGIPASCLTVGDDGAVWCGTTEGLYRREGSGWTLFTTNDGLANDNVLSLSIDLTGRVWAATSKGVDIFDGKSWTRFWWFGVSHTAHSASGEHWLAYRQEGGVGCFKGTEQQGYSIYEYLHQRFATALTIGPDNTVWVAAYGGVCRVKDTVWTAYRLPDDYLTREIYDVSAIAPDHHGRLWAVISGGLYCLENGKWSAYTGIDTLRLIRLDKVCLAPDGALWMTTRDEGAFRFIPETPLNAGDATETCPAGVRILGNRPNPFNPSTTISFTISEPGRANLSIYSISGQKVRELLSGDMTYKSYGTHTTYTIIWDGRDDSGAPVSSGVYLYRLIQGKHAAVGRMALVK